jgi:biotin operon repressor
MEFVDPEIRLAASSRDGHLALRRVERQQVLIERLHATRGKRVRLEELAHELGVSARTVARDVERLRISGVPLDARQGRGGGVSILPTGAVMPIAFDLPGNRRSDVEPRGARADCERERDLGHAQTGRRLEPGQLRGVMIGRARIRPDVSSRPCPQPLAVDVLRFDESPADGLTVVVRRLAHD